MRNPSRIFLLSFVLAAMPSLAHAQNRALEEARFIDGTVGAVAGALIGGPLGLIAGAAIGYAIGPEIAGPNPRLLTPARRHNRRVARRRARPAPAAAQYQQVYQPYPQQQYMAYPQQPMYMAPTAPPGYQPLPGQLATPGYNPQRQMFNPRQNPLVPSPGMMGGGQQYSAAVQSGPSAAGQQGASGAYGAAGYSPQGAAPYGQGLAAPVPMPR